MYFHGRGPKLLEIYSTMTGNIKYKIKYKY